jgi:beta-mannanase
MIGWGHGGNTTEIANGSQDAAIKQFAQSIKAINTTGRIFFRYGFEMDGAFNSSWVVSAQDFIAAWRHVRALFTQEGVTNVVWIWNATEFGFRSGRAAAYYPGDAYVDVIGADGYNWSHCLAGDKDLPFETMFQPMYDFAQAHGKRAMACEYGVETLNPNAGTEFSQVPAVVASWTDLFALVYFDETDSPGNRCSGGQLPSWSPASSALNAFVTMANSAPLSRTPPPNP